MKFKFTAVYAIGAIALSSTLIKSKSNNIDISEVTEYDLLAAAKILQQCAKRAPLLHCLTKESKCEIGDKRCYCHNLLNSMEKCLSPDEMIAGKCSADEYLLAKRLVTQQEVAACDQDGMAVKPLSSSAASIPNIKALLITAHIAVVTTLMMVII